MKFIKPLVHGILIKRYKRFLADVILDDGTTVTAHCTNSGSMKSCLEPGAEVYLSEAADPSRRTRFTWEMIRIGGDWVGINTTNPNRLALEAVKCGQIPGLEGFDTVRPEVKYGDSRFDLYAENESEKCFIEVKNVTLKEGKYALFPDSITTRGLKHLKTLIEIKRSGMRAVMLYVIQRKDVEVFAPAMDIDPEYAAGLKQAVFSGVEVIPVMASVSPEQITVEKLLSAEI